MSALLHVPVLLQEDHAGLFTAHAIAPDVEWQGSAVASTQKKALTQVAEFLRWWADRNEDFRLQEFHDPELLEYAVSVRPTYRLGDRDMPCEQTVRVNVSCVRYRDEYDNSILVAPRFKLAFHFHDARRLPTLVREFVQHRLDRHDPAMLGPYLAPARTTLASVAVRGNPRKKQQFVMAPPTLRNAADPVTGRTFRQRHTHAFERAESIEQLVQTLTHSASSVLLLGETGCGKTTVLAHAARRIRADADGGIDDESCERFWFTSAARLIAGMKYLGEWQERCEEIIADLSPSSGMLCIDNLLDLIRAGDGTPEGSVGAFLADFVQAGELRLIAEATPLEYNVCRRLLPALTSALHVISISALEEDAAVNVVSQLAKLHGERHKLLIDPQVAIHTHGLFSGILPDHHFPGETNSFLGTVCDAARKHRHEKVTPADITRHFIARTGLPEFLLRPEIPLARDEVVRALSDRIVGQDAAVAAVTERVLAFKAGLNDPRRPLGVLFFTGPTGVGKTALARALTDYCFGHGKEKDRLLRLDMSEYAFPGSAARLIADGKGGPSELIQRLRRQPFQVLLFDEIEKAHHSVYDALLGLLDEGRLTDPYGRTASCQRSFVILTSNLGTVRGDRAGFGEGDTPTYANVVRKYFRPEFFNRLDAVVEFRPLSEEVVRRLAQRELDQIADRPGLQRLRLRIHWSKVLVARLAVEGYDPHYGARPLQRVIEQRVVEPLACFLIEHAELRRGTLRADLDQAGVVVFEIQS